MVRPPGVKIPLLELEVSTARSSDIGRACSVTGRSQRWNILEWVMLNPELLKKFFIRMTEEERVRRFYTNLYDLLRLCHLRIFDEKAPVIEAVEDSLNKAVVLSLDAEKNGLEADEAQVLIRKRRVSWLEDLTKDWDLKERTRWREVVPGIPKTKLRSGVKRSRSKSKIKPIKLKRMRIRARIPKADCAAGVGSGGSSGPAPSQSGLGLPGTGSGLGAMDDGGEDVVILGGADSSEGSEVENTAHSIKVSETKKPVKRMSAATRRSRKDGARVMSYDELIKGGEKAEIAFPDGLDFQFEIPPDVENFEAW